MITPEFIGQTYRNTLNGDVWRANSLTPGDWTKIAGSVGGSNLDGAGDPTGVVTPGYVGQYYRDTSTGNVWKSTGATSADWVLSVQDMGVRWTPNNLDFGGNIEYKGNVEIEGATSLTFQSVNLLGGVYLDGQGLSVSPITISFPNATTVDPDANANASIEIVEMSALVSFDAPMLSVVGTLIQIKACDVLTGINLSSLISVGYKLIISNNNSLIVISLPNFTGGIIEFPSNVNLTDVSIPSFLPANGDNLTITSAALTLTSADHILSRCVANASYISGIVNISGGTSAAPTQGPGSDHDILVARGVTIVHN